MRIIFLLLIFGFMACKSQKNIQESKTTSVESIALEKFGNASPISQEMDDSETLVLCKNYSKKSNVDQHTNVRFLVIDSSTKKIIAEENIGRGTVQWYKDKILIIRKTPGIMQDGETMDDYSYLLDPMTMTKTKLSEKDIKKL